MVNSDDENTGDGWRGPKLRTNARSGFGGQFPYSRDTMGSGYTDRNTLQLYDALDYPFERELDFDTWLAYYYREGQIAGVLDKLVSDTWYAGVPPVADNEPTGEDDEDEDTPFEKDVTKLFDHNSDLNLRAPLLDRLIAADILATLGKYSVLLFGFSDDAEVSEELEEDAVDGDGLDGLDYVEVFAEKDIEFDLVKDFDDPRHGRPEAYYLGDDNAEVHHSRVVHVAENTLVDPYEGIPWFKPIVNLIVNIQKILGASPEGYFRAGYSPIAVSPPPSFKNLGSDTHPNVQKVPGTFGDAKSELSREIESTYQEFQRTFFTNGEVEMLSPNVADPSPHMDEQWAAIAAAKDLPQSILKGQESGERATVMDDASLRRRVSGRQTNYAETRIYRPVLDINAYAGVLSDPDGDGYDVNWEPLSEETDMEIAKRRNVEADTFATLSQVFQSPVGTTPEGRAKLMDWSPEVGSEAPGDAQQQQQQPIDSRTVMDRMDMGGGAQPITSPSESGGSTITTETSTVADGGVSATSRGNADENADDEDATDE